TRGEAVVAGAAVLVGLSAARFAAPNYTLEPSYTDHLLHEYSSWAFLHIGFRIFDTPLGQWHVHAKHVHVLWPRLPTLYPPAAGLALLGIYWSRQAAPGRGLVALSLALSLQFRLWYLWPFALHLAWRHQREIRPWQLALSAALAVSSLVAFGLAVPFVRNLG